MSDIFVGDNDHGDAVPPTDVLLEMIKTLREDVVHFANELNEVTNQRDAARREVCRLMSMFNAENSVQIAASRSWDCFKEDGK
jgi:hypothetical protein